MAQTPLIAHVIHHLVIGGMENGLVNLINRIPQDRYRHVVICAEDFSDFRDRITRADVDVLALKKSTLTRTAMYRRLRGIFEDLRPVIVHGRNLSGLDALLPAWRAGVRARIQGEHGWDVSDIDGSRLRPRLLRRLHSPLVSRYVTVSKHLAQYLTARIGVSPERIAQIYNGVDTQRFRQTAEKPASILPASFYGKDKVVVGTIGRLQPVKDQVTLVCAFAQIIRDEPRLRAIARLVIVGDGPLRDELAARTVQEGIADVTWLAGAREDVAYVLQCLDVFVLPSLNEGISNTLLEAMATGLPVIATAVGGNVELVADDINGRLIPPAKPQLLAAEIKHYVLDNVLRSRHGEASRVSVLSNFSIDRMVDSYVRLYDSLRVTRA